MASIAEKYSNQIYVTSDNPRKENLDDINKDIVQGLKKSNHNIIPNRSIAIKEAMKKMDQNTVLLILGKGNEEYQEIGDQKITYSDYKAIKSSYNENKN